MVKMFLSIDSSLIRSNTPGSQAQASMPSSNLSSQADIEKGTATVDYAHLTNTTVHGYSWEDVTVTVKDRGTKESVDLLSGVNGLLEAGMQSFVLNLSFNSYGGLPKVQVKCWHSWVPGMITPSMFKYGPCT
jgi:hypothetical protein